MKKIITIVAMILSTSAFSRSPEAEFAKKFVDGWKNETTCKTCISDDYYKKYGMTSDDDIAIDKYLEYSRAEIYKDTPPFIEIRIFFEKSGKINGARDFRFNIAKSNNGKYGIIPPYSPHNSSKFLSIDPWIFNIVSIENSIDVDENNRTKQIQESKEIGEKFDLSLAEVATLVSKSRALVNYEKDVKKFNSTKVSGSKEALFARNYLIDRTNGDICNTECISKAYLTQHNTSSIKTNGISNAPFEVKIVQDTPPFIVLELRRMDSIFFETYQVGKEGSKYVFVPKSKPREMADVTWVDPWVYRTQRLEPQHRDQGLNEAINSIQKTIIQDSRVNWIRSLKEGDQTNCGPIIEVKASMVKVYFPVQNYGNEHWISKNEIQSPNYGCRFVNGRYTGTN